MPSRINLLAYPALAALLFVLPASSARAQGEIIRKAMKDELERSMKELSLEGYKKPFFISYTLKDTKTFTVVATLGALARSSDFPSRQTAVRVLVGSYAFNDESLDDNLFSSPGGNEIQVPLNDDYYGIRRAFWGSTDEVYKSAARQFARNEATLKDQNKNLEEIPHRYLAKVPVIQVNTAAPAPGLDQTALENLARELSGLFKSYPDMEVSGAVINYTRETTFFVNSEGIDTQTSASRATVQVTAQARTDKGEPLIDQLTLTAASPAGWPPAADLIRQAKAMADGLIQARGVKVFQEEYSGPVLFQGQAVADLFATCLFGRESITATNTIGNTNGYRFDSNSSLDEKIGKKITADALTVKAKSRLKKFGPVDLLGSFDADDEGVAPPEELTLIENGILKNLLNDRTITKPDQTANGHGAGPGVLQVTLGKTTKPADLLAGLLAKAKAEGLDYAIVIRDASMARMGLLNVYRVNVKDGSEELLRGAALESLGLRSLRKIAGATEELAAYNLPLGPRSANVVSWIVPAATLLEEVDLKPANLPFFKEELYVQNPLKR